LAAVLAENCLAERNQVDILRSAHVSSGCLAFIAKRVFELSRDSAPLLLALVDKSAVEACLIVFLQKFHRIQTAQKKTMAWKKQRNLSARRFSRCRIS
jgi:hypothetical protein